MDIKARQKIDYISAGLSVAPVCFVCGNRDVEIAGAGAVLDYQPISFRARNVGAEIFGERHTVQIECEECGAATSVDWTKERYERVFYRES